MLLDLYENLAAEAKIHLGGRVHEPTCPPSCVKRVLGYHCAGVRSYLWCFGSDSSFKVRQVAEIYEFGKR